MFFHKIWAVGAAVLVVLGTGCSSEASFQKDVYPVLQQRCLPCHRAGGDGYEASGFSIETYSGVMKGTKFGPVIQPGSSVSSTLMRMLKHETASVLNMPHGANPLTPEQIKVIEVWIDNGAKDN